MTNEQRAHDLATTLVERIVEAKLRLDGQGNPIELALETYVDIYKEFLLAFEQEFAQR